MSHGASSSFVGNYVPLLSKAIVLLTFLFQNSYQYLLYTQQWSFVGSVLSMDEGATWFATITGCSSLFCTLTGMLVPRIVKQIGLLGLMGTTCFTLLISLLLADQAYELAQTHGFDPSSQMQERKKDKKKPSSPIQQTVGLFRRNATLRALLVEVLSFQSLNTILHVALIRQLTAGDVMDAKARSAYTGRLYALISGVSASMQFLAFPFVLRHCEPRWIWRAMPLLPFLICLRQCLSGGVGLPSSSSSLLFWAATAFALAKIMDYSTRSVVFPMAFQPLDFESRYIGKEVIGVLGSRIGKSGMSLL